MKRTLKHEPDTWINLPECHGAAKTVHFLDAESHLAIEAALGTKRPLLVRGEPGTGKSQLARAAAECLDAALIVKVLDGRTEIEDLFWRFDAVRRLADAQVLASFQRGEAKEDGDASTRKTLKALIQGELAEERYLIPEALWWTFDWKTADKQAGKASSSYPVDEAKKKQAATGRVLLIDEIDKADESVPNGLLAALGAGSFSVRGREDIRWSNEDPPLIVITTNEERPLPDAFLRRCLVLHLALPENRDELIAWLVDRGENHMKREKVKDVQTSVLEKAAHLVADDRVTMRQYGHNPPGQAEYLDLIRAAFELFEDEQERLDRLDDLRDFTLCKHQPRKALRR